MKEKHINALNRVRKYFPNVEEVKDATENVVVQVTRNDNSAGRKKDPRHCALARACIRQKLADGAIIGIAFSWLIKGKVATRYKTSEGVAREITSFDRHQDFVAGADYLLSAVSPGARLGMYPSGTSGKKPAKNPGEKRVIHHHRTANIRVM